MKICLVGKNISNFVLAKALTNKKLSLEKELIKSKKTLYWRKRFFSSQICSIYESKIIFFVLSNCMDGF